MIFRISRLGDFLVVPAVIFRGVSCCPRVHHDSQYFSVKRFFACQQPDRSRYESNPRILGVDYPNRQTHMIDVYSVCLIITTCLFHCYRICRILIRNGIPGIFVAPLPSPAWFSKPQTKRFLRWKEVHFSNWSGWVCFTRRSGVFSTNA